MEQKSVSMVEKLGLDKSKYLDVNVNGKNYAIKRPSVSKMLEMEDACSSIDGVTDVGKYISKIVELLAPKVTLDDICPVDSEFTLMGHNGFELEVKNLNARKMLDITANTVNVESDGKGGFELRTNQLGMLESILQYTDIKDVDNLPSYQDAKLLIQDFSQRVDVQPLMELYEFFRINFQS